MLGIAVGTCFITGLLSYFQYQRGTGCHRQRVRCGGVPRHAGGACGHGMATIPLLLVKLWSVYPNHFRWPPFRSVKHVLERLTVALLVSSTLVQLFTGFFNVLGWYPFRWDFLSVHYYLAYVVVGSVLLHIGVKLPDIVYGCRRKSPRATAHRGSME